MTLRPEYTLHHSDLGDFLSAPVWEERGGSQLSILSAFARLGLDPWGEAALLATMPRQAATETLASILSRLPYPGPEEPDLKALAWRLVESLPNRDGPRTNGSPSRSGAVEMRNPIAIVAWIVAVLGALQLLGLLF